MLDLHGQRAVVTGAATGIGEAIAKRLAMAGATVIIADIDGSAAQAAAARVGGAAQWLCLDVTDPDAVEQSIGGILNENGGLQILINNAGVAGKATRPLRLWRALLQ